MKLPQLTLRDLLLAGLLLHGMVGQILSADIALSDELDAWVYVRWNLPNSLLEKLPDWKDTEEHPPVSARKARQLADTSVSELAKKARIDPSRMKFRQMSLENVIGRKWIWRVWYANELAAADSEGTVGIVVLPSGEALKADLRILGSDRP